MARKTVDVPINAPSAWWKKVNSVMYHLGWVARSHEPCLWKLMSKDGRILGLCDVHVDDFLVAFDESKMATRKHFDDLKPQSIWGSWEDVNLSSVECAFVTTFAHNQWVRFAWINRKAIESLQCSSTARDEQALTARKVSADPCIGKPPRLRVGFRPTFDPGRPQTQQTQRGRYAGKEKAKLAKSLALLLHCTWRTTRVLCP